MSLLTILLSPMVSEAAVQAFQGDGGPPPDPLTPREVQVLQLLAEVKSAKGTGALLGISVKTVESHRCRIMEKLNIHDTPGLVRHAIRRGLIQP